MLQKYTNKITLYPTFSPAASPLSLEILSETRHIIGGRKQISFKLKREHQEILKFERASHLTLQRYVEAECKVSYMTYLYPTYDPIYIVGPGLYLILIIKVTGANSQTEYFTGHTKTIK